MDAWCRHHASCSRIAPSKEWPDFEACRAETRERVIRAHRCAIDPARAQACVAALDDKECDAFMVRTPRPCELCD